MLQPAGQDRSTRRRPGGLLGRLRVRKKLLVLHTAFTLSLAVTLAVALRPAVLRVVAAAEEDKAADMLRSVLVGERFPLDPTSTTLTGRLAGFSSREGLLVRLGRATELELEPEDALRAANSPGEPVALGRTALGAAAAVFVPTVGSEPGTYLRADVRIGPARRAVLWLYVLTLLALLGVYVAVALALETLVLPQAVYRPIQRILDADSAVREGRRDEELVPPGAITADELGEIMISRNEAVLSLRRNQEALNDALARLEAVATDLKLKNHLLETARRNLADADRLVALGVMSAGIAHELNTPLAVIKGLVERLDANPRAGVEPETAALMLRVVRRLERLSESLLDFARVRPARTAPAGVAPMVEEAVTLVRLDRDARLVEFDVRVPEGLTLECDADRLLQVVVNLVRNAVDAVRSGVDAGLGRHRVEVVAAGAERDGREWVTISVADDGPGIDPAVLPRLFEPFASTRLDAKGTGLGLAVADSIVREHGGVILARNRGARGAGGGTVGGAGGAVFEVVLPARQPAPAGAPGENGAIST